MPRYSAGPRCPASNFAGALAEKNRMKGLLRVREPNESEDDDDDQVDSYRPNAVLRLRCYACAGTGKLELLEQGERQGRIVRCIACGGSGKVEVN
jgi:hypothetical protein